MARKKRKVPGYNAASTADIAFMLLLFFLMTTTMDTDEGLPRRLPNPPDPNQIVETKINERNVLKIHISSTNDIMCNYEEVNLAQLRAKVIEFIENPNNSETLPEKKPVDIPIFGTQMLTKDHVISLLCDITTKYQVYIDVQNELVAAYNDLRNALSRRQFGKEFKELDEEQQKAVTEYYPQHISEAEPKNYGAKK